MSLQFRHVGLLACFGAFLSGCGGGGQADKIIRVSRQNNSGTYVYFRESILDAGRDFKAGSYDMSGSKDVVELVAKTPGAIGFSGMGYATDQVKMLPVSKDGGEPVAPTLENALDGSYPLARPLYLYLTSEPTGALKHYIDWIKSEEGQKVVAEQGYVPIKPGPAPNPDDAASTSTTISVAGSDTMVNVAQRWAEVYGEKYPNVDVQVSGGGSGTGIAKLINGTAQIANASRDLNEEEREQAGGHVVEITVALDALAVYVHKDNPLNSISLANLAEIYGDGGSIESWTSVDGWPKSDG